MTVVVVMRDGIRNTHDEVKSVTRDQKNGFLVLTTGTGCESSVKYFYERVDRVEESPAYVQTNKCYRTG